MNTWQNGASEAVRSRGEAVRLHGRIRAGRPFLVWLLLVGLAMLVAGVSCTRPVDESASGQGASADPAGFPGINLDVDQARNDAINEAIQVATAGCPGAPDALSGPPTRILMAVTRLVQTGGLVNPEANFDDLGTVAPGGGGSGAASVWVVAIEGHSTAGAGDDASGSRPDLRSFVFVLAPWNPIITGCVIRDAPMATNFWDMTYGGFEFDVLFDPQSQ